jgi:hypothetical protein
MIRLLPLNMTLLKNSIRFCLPIYFVFLLSQSLLGQCDPYAAEIPLNQIDEDCDGLDDVFLTLPPYIYLLEDQPFQLFFHNTILSKHPSDYTFEVNCPLGGVTTATHWSFTPGSQQVGLYSFKLIIRSSSGQFLTDKTCQIRVASKTTVPSTTQSELFMLGHSFLDQGYLPYYMYQLTHQPNSNPISFHGSKSSWANASALHEGQGGKTWRWFAENQASPLLNNGQIDFNTYFNTYIGPGKTPEWVIIYLDVNDFMGYSDLEALTLQSVDDTIQNCWNTYALPLITNLKLSAPDCKIGICLVPPAHGAQSAFDSIAPSLPRLSDRWRWQKIVSRVHFKNIERYSNRENEGIYLLPIYLNINSLTDFPANDPVHPRPGNLLPSQTFGGYNLVAETIFAWLKYVQQNNQTPQPTFYRDSDDDGYGSFQVTIQAATAPSGYVSNALDCDDNNANIFPGAVEICGNGKDDNCNSTIDEDITGPIAKCKTGVVLPLSDLGTLEVLPEMIDNQSSDLCGIQSRLATPQFLNCQTIGLQEIILKVTDAAGNIDTCSTQVMIADTLKPDLVCTDQFLNIPETGELNVTAQSGITYTYDNCTLDTTTLSTEIFHFSCADVGSSTSVTLQLADKQGNTRTCTYDIFIFDILDFDNDQVSNCADACPVDMGTSTGYTYFIDLDGDEYGAGSLLTNCTVPSNGVSNGNDCDDTNPNINPQGIEIVNNAFDEDCNGVIDSIIAVTNLQDLSYFSLLPNPGNAVLTVRSNEPIQSISIFDLAGRIIYQERNAHQHSIVIDASRFVEGTYQIQFKLSDGRQVTRKWIKIQ